MFVYPYFFPTTGFSRMAALAILPVMLRMAYRVIGKAELSKRDGLIITTDSPIAPKHQKLLRLTPLEEL